MRQALYTEPPNDFEVDCPLHSGGALAWSDGLPTPLKNLVVPPVRFALHQDYEMSARHTDGCDASNRPCFCEFEYVVTQLRSDDDEVYYEAPVYSESLTSWRLIDERWLVCQTKNDRLKPGGPDTRFYLSETRPR